ncbi:DNA-binding MarR family transcriptional regulator/DNA-binding CsgD family transcriptional regulator [Allocatelliglobosispora scoriae]|uniref:DNA-binding MarR family transcriptional regulator/DNA-binding CsgD family transcriptional regulator n=1 Tax=Allocatelliglobosispora scoriae TaxID=643052 RepID=A0A841BTA3_9ACTN|nr:helix-turn-helix domain-containing protein [Allocatelliglobosispora scoriae]MBB5870389.1 DNA-binding MarR family transcriptional regulator/DNA-binding CsgD family transcriptional regulator [Allocatelliglobosispora scoriae]
MTSELTAAGVDPFDETVYRAVLSRRQAAPAELAADLGHTPDRVVRALDRLENHGLVGRLAGSRRRYAAIEPQAALGALIRNRAAELDRVRGAADELSRLFASAQAGVSDEVEIAIGSEALGRWFVRLQQEARDEVITLDRPPYALTTSNPVEATALTRGVKYRAVYAPEALEWPGVLGDIRELVKHGEQARVLPGLRIKLAISDRRLALMPLSLDLTDVRAAVIRPSALLDGLIDFWEMCWQQAIPLEAPADDPLADDDRDLLTLLVSGLKDEAIARQLGWSVRTMRRRISRLHELLGADNRFQAGVIATRRGLI